GEIGRAATPWPAEARGMDLVRPTTPCLVATYAPWFVLPARPEVEAMLMMQPPPRGSMACSAAWQHRKAPLRLTSMVADHHAGSSSATRSDTGAAGRLRAALLTNTSRPPNAS